jgi:hypothetical protein
MGQKGAACPLFVFGILTSGLVYLLQYTNEITIDSAPLSSPQFMPFLNVDAQLGYKKTNLQTLKKFF